MSTSPLQEFCVKPNHALFVVKNIIGHRNQGALGVVRDKWLCLAKQDL
jgi:hypothetical protein